MNIYSAMEVVCGWCGAHLGWKSGKGISHGLCRSCQKEQDRQLEELKAGKK